MPDVFGDLSWGEFIRMQKGYLRRKEREAYNLATLLAAVYNTIPRKSGKFLTPKDFLYKERHSMSIEDQQALALQAVENSKRFDRGVIYETNW